MVKERTKGIIILHSILEHTQDLDQHTHKPRWSFDMRYPVYSVVQLVGQVSLAGIVN